MENNHFKKTFEAKEAEKKWYQYWLDHNLFHAMDCSSQKPFSIVIPPPNVTGMLHMGHALNNVLQDIIIRYRRMKGDNTLWMPGTDHAGIATQNVVEQELAKEGISRHDLGREKFIERIWEWKGKYGGVIINQLKRLGCSCDWERERFTMDAGLSRAVREVFVKLYRNGLIYRGDYIVNWCPRCHTAISDLEVEYYEQNGNLWNIRYPFADGSGEIIVATTRPETMLGDTAVAVHPSDERYRNTISKEVILPLMDRKIPIIADEYVSMEFGSGAVKITPACDPNDFVIAERHNLPIIKIMDGSATINENGGLYQGHDRYEARTKVIRDLEQQGYLISTEPYKHNIGRCYRCKTDIEPMVSRQWFVRVLPLARAASAAVVKGQTRIIPPMWEGTYFEWLDNIRDWCISRQIWWGHRIPVWTCENCKKVTVSADDPTSCPDCGDKRLLQEEDVLDTWFSSALWPFSTLGWPDATPALKTFYPTSLLITGFDILFFWVARMMMMGLYVMGDVPFKDVYLHALVRDEAGDKMSKSKGNIIDPLEMVDKYGADAFRFTLAAFTAQGRDIRMSEERIEGYKYFVNKIWNAARFSAMNLYDFRSIEDHDDKESESLADRWIRSRLNWTLGEINRALDEYRFNEAAAYIYQFVWHEFCDWYLEVIKPVLYGKDDTGKKSFTQQTLHTVLKTSLQLLHPFMPFVTEEIWHESLAQRSSIMTSSFPESHEEWNDPAADEEMGFVMQIITRVRNIRGEINLPPSKKLSVILFSASDTTRKLLENVSHYIINLANLSNLNIQNRDIEPKHAAVGVVGSIKLYVLLEGMDLSVEVARLEKELLKVEKELDIVSRKLANRDFLERANQVVIQKEEDKFKKFMERHAITKEALKKLQEIM